MNIVLIGYMGSGKSLVGRCLSETIGSEYLDLDDYIEAEEKKTIKNIFEEKGEVYFRKKEHFYLKKVLGAFENTVISLGGGTPCFSGNIEIINKLAEGRSIYLQTGVDELVERLFGEKNKRPLIAHLDTKEALQDFIRKHLFERSFYYNQAAYKIITDKKALNDIVAEIQAILK
ncbi:shikimate kinase [Aquimarina sp. TRL1]|uniref:shikimate kinase n=1 Tax=Aquimarina sp. (strain TRL1) TaxID=2736252 RepID=UPI00158F5CED|nr:shikimate kinase [Aquimarina sp. TRL1]QKX05681.1 shikimate kinase [Aquimarina sp. TRL1]